MESNGSPIAGSAPACTVGASRRTGTQPDATELAA